MHECGIGSSWTVGEQKSQHRKTSQAVATYLGQAGQGHVAVRKKVLSTHAERVLWSMMQTCGSDKHGQECLL